MPAVSKKQQRFFGMVRAAQKGEGATSPEVAKVADEISNKDAKKFAKTKHKGLPEKKKMKEETSTYEKLKKKKYQGVNESVQNNKVDLILKTDVNNVLKQENKDYDRGLLAKVNKDGSYDVAYWYDEYKAYPVEVVIDGKSIKKDAKNIHIKYHPELKKKNKEEAKDAMKEETSTYEKLKKKIGSKEKHDKAVSVDEGVKEVKEEDNYSTRDKELKKTSKPRSQRYKALHSPTNKFGNVDVNEGVMDIVKRYGKKKEEKKPQKAMDAGARGRRMLKRREHAKYVSGSTENVPDSIREGSLHKWFKGSKSKDGKGGWVNVVTGGTCASDEPGEGTPKCVSSSKRASMTKAERESASRRKKAADPGQQSKSGAAKPTYVKTDSKKKMKESKDLEVIAKELDGASKMHKKQAKRVRKHIKDMHTEAKKPYGMKKKGGKMVPNCKPVGSVKKEEVVVGEAKVDKKLPDYKRATARDKRYGNPYGSHELGGGIRKDRRADHEAKRGVKEEVVTEADKKGKGSGKKDACYHKVKASAKVWPSAYASGRLVQCRKKGAANYGNSKKESYSWRDELDFVQEGAAWTKKSGKNKEGGLNEKGRKSYERENPGSDLKAPQPEGGSRKKSFCARMGGMKKKLTSAKTANDPDSRINKALRKWKC